MKLIDLFHITLTSSPYGKTPKKSPSKQINTPEYPSSHIKTLRNIHYRRNKRPSPNNEHITKKPHQDMERKPNYMNEHKYQTTSNVSTFLPTSSTYIMNPSYIMREIKHHTEI